ncbi:MAG: hypothetical protein FWC10_07825 [Lentimicrobiaceae bacterium]|nr:hypothetical protein [Lentimicrobiaceae bacterium]
MTKTTQRKVPKKEIRKEAKQLLNQGDKTKQEVFELLVDKYKYSKDVAGVLKYIPTKQAVKKYGIWNSILLIFLVITTILVFLTMPIQLIWYVPLIYIVASKKLQYYFWVTVLFSLMAIGFFIVFISTLFTQPFDTTIWIFVVVSMFFVIPGCILPLWLQKKLCPKPIERREVYVNAEGNKRVQLVYEFPEKR